MKKELPSRLGFFSLLRLAPAYLGWAIVVAIASAALSLLPFWLIYVGVAELLRDQPDMGFVGGMVAWIFGVLALRWALMAVSHVLAHMGAFAIQRRLRLAMVSRLGQVPLSFFAGRHSGSLRRTLTDDVSTLEGFFAHMLPDTVAAVAVPLVALGLLFVADWRLALAAFAPLPLAMLAQWWFMRGSTERMRTWHDMQQGISNKVGEYVRGIHVVKSFGLEMQSFAGLTKAVNAAVDLVVSYAKQVSQGWVLFVGLLTANLVMVAPLGAWLYLQGSLDLATWVLFLLVAPAVFTPLLRLTFALGEQVQRAEALARITAVVAAPVLEQQATAAVPDGPLDIEFKNVAHRYGERLALEEISFTAKAGQVTAVVGASGSGKSTLLRLVGRLYECETGFVSIGAVDVRDWPLDALMEQQASVFQDVFLLYGTVRENLLLACPQASDQQIEAATRAACAHDFICALPQGYDTPLGDRGVRLSGGERQRLSIARALLKNAPILLLDEATASVDMQNEALIQQALVTLCQGRTVLMVAHRLRTVMHAHQIVVLESGRLIGKGTHSELLESCAAYKKLWDDHEQARQWSLNEGREEQP